MGPFSSSSVKHRRSIAAACCVALIQAANGAERQARPQPPPPQELAARATRELLTPVKNSLAQQLASDARLAALVSSLTMDTVSPPHPHLGRNAGATAKGGPAVLVDLEFLAEIMQISSFGAVGLLRTDPADALIKSTLTKRDRDLAAAAKGASLEPFQLDVAALPGGASLRSLLDRLGVEVSLTTTAWLVLHEVGHHVLNHLAATPASFAESRQWEEAADAWAYETLHQLGYHLMYLNAFFQARDVLEALALRHGLATPEASSTHPSYETRLANLNKLYDVDKPSPTRMLAFLGVGWDSRGQPQLVETWIPRYPDDDMQLLAMVTSGSESKSVVFDWIKGEVHLYSRSAAGLTELTVRKPDAMRTPVTVVNRKPGSGGEQRVEQVWLQTTLAWAKGRRIENVPVGVVLDQPMVTILRESLRDSGVDAPTADSVVREFRGYFGSLRQGLIGYARGETTLEAFAASMESRAGGFSGRLQKTLGPKWTKTFEEQFVTNSLMIAMMDALAKPR